MWRWQISTFPPLLHLAVICQGVFVCLFLSTWFFFLFWGAWGERMLYLEQGVRVDKNPSSAPMWSIELVFRIFFLSLLPSVLSPSENLQHCFCLRTDLHRSRWKSIMSEYSATQEWLCQKDLVVYVVFFFPHPSCLADVQTKEEKKQGGGGGGAGVTQEVDESGNVSA